MNLNKTDLNKIHNPRSIALIAYLQSGLDPYVNLVAVEVKDSAPGIETVIFDLKVERPNNVVADIRYEERVAVQFDEKDTDHPEVLALRDDFPTLPHTNLRSEPKPISLCLYDRPFDDIRMTWTPEAFVHRIQEWFSKSAVGALHDQNQPLEPFLPLSLPKLVLPEDFFSKLNEEHPSFHEIFRMGEESSPTYIVHTARTSDKEFPSVVGCHFVTPEVTHGVINKLTGNFGDLNEILSKIGFDLPGKVREQLLSWHKKGFLSSGLLKARLSIMLTVPHRRDREGAVEQIHPWVFVTEVVISELGKQLGIWDCIPGKKDEVGLLLPPDLSKNAKDLALFHWVPIAPFSKEIARKMNGNNTTEIVGAIVGLGALGGYVAINLARSGYGKWTYIDSDVLLPHNFSRHVAFGKFNVGSSKARVVSDLANAVVNDNTYSKFHIGDVLSSDDKAGIEAELLNCDVIIDCTASVPATRSLSLDFKNVTKRRVALFLTPDGKNLVMMAEPADRSIPIDSIEMQYLRALCEHPELKGHLNFDLSKNRYARTCGDVSGVIPNDLVALHAAIASSQIKDLDKNNGSVLSIWSGNPETMEFKKTDIQLASCLEMVEDDWTVVVDEGLVKKLKSLRESKLPNETGGSLVGTFDFSRKRIYVVDTLPTPSDSVESRTEFIRGEVGNSAQLERVQKLTANQLFYLGEWHSHPRGIEAIPSGTDEILFKILESKMHLAGIPAVMLIVGDDDCTLQFSLPDYLPESKRADIPEHVQAFLVLND